VSFRVLVVPEDPTHNGYILRPLVQRIMSECGRPNSRVVVLSNPKASGYEHAKSLLVSKVLDSWSHFNLVLFLPDADGKDKSHEFQNLEAIADTRGVKLFCCAAVQEVEVWLLAGHTSKLSSPWTKVRADTSLKENVFEPFLKAHGDPKRAGGGRDLLMRETLSNYSGLRDRCPELAVLETRIHQSLTEVDTL
jgi:hypothetical protein